MPNKYKRTKVADDAQARRLLIDIFTKYHQSKDINNRSLGLAIQALDKESNTKGLIGRPEIHKIDSLYQVGAPAREIVKYIAETGVGTKGYNTKVFTPQQLADDGVIKRMRDFYNYAKKRGLNHAAATGLMSMVYGETLMIRLMIYFHIIKLKELLLKVIIELLIMVYLVLRIYVNGMIRKIKVNLKLIGLKILIILMVVINLILKLINVKIV